MPNSLIPAILISASSVLFITAISPDTDSTRVNKILPSTVVSPPIPEYLFLAGEQVPTESFSVREKLDRELIINTYGHSSSILYLKRASRWFPLIEPILEEHGIPNDFKYLAVIESGLTQAVSPAGASGFWQFMKKTAPEYELEVTSTVDERYHVEKSTHAACQYLLESYEKFGNWGLAAASYNMGMTGVEHRLEAQGVDSYWELHLNSETGRYVYRLLAVKEVLSHPETYGFQLTENDLYLPHEVRKVAITASIENLSEFALKNGSNYRELKELNPWLIKDSFVASPGKTYTVYFPKTVTE
ncbi:MAG: lytic transglycosylase domain-containing protein [Bacteroidetes bacterium]|nr:lytic transglycosylase domain-containing protein [Bacteroidota bacterium]MDA0732125.1 lytic transglycosylase domain-containing protein [Bacteroidota bacterium]MDA0980639.1 lytic transglycosylase domain-containing protein [Bacteroidota bacterium]